MNLPTTLVLACHHDKPQAPACEGKDHEEGTPNQTNPGQSGKSTKDSKDKQKDAGKNTPKPKQNS